MCNLYSYIKGQAAIIAITRAMTDKTGNMPPLPGIFPDYPAPIVRNNQGTRELAMARWGMQSPVFAVKGRNSDPGITKRPQCEVAPLAALARCGKPLPRALHKLLGK